MKDKIEITSAFDGKSHLPPDQPIEYRRNAGIRFNGLIIATVWYQGDSEMSEYVTEILVDALGDYLEANPIQANKFRTLVKDITPSSSSSSS